MARAQKAIIWALGQAIATKKMVFLQKCGLIGWVSSMKILVMRCLAVFCFFVATVFIIRGLSGVVPVFIQGNEEGLAHLRGDKVRLTKRMVARRGPQTFTVERKLGLKALRAAAEVTPMDGRHVQWSKFNAQHHLSKLTRADIKVLVVEFLAQKVSPVSVVPKDSAVMFAFETNYSKLISSLVGRLAKKDFTDTLDWLEELPVLQKDIMLARVVYAYAINAAAAQDPERAWLVYKEKCPPWGG